MSQNQYKAAGVDVETGDALVDWLVAESEVPSAHQEKIVGGIGGFASLFRFPQSRYKKPCLVTCTDGVGTKVLLASKFQDFSRVGQDLVAMCVNDLICTGGDPLLFLDYYAVGKLEMNAAKSFLSGVRKACAESSCALVGGETAEMPGVYQPGDFDCAGFAVGVVDEDEAWGPQKVQDGDRMLAIESSGFHSNGYSLLRRLFEKDLDTWKDQLMIPTSLYVQLTKKMKDSKIEVHAAAHITGGGMENVPRVLPEHLVWIEKDWEFPPAFQEVQKRSRMSRDEMKKTLNCGIGFIFILPDHDWHRAQGVAEGLGFKTYDLGILKKKNEGRSF